ncbi:hypothetical protein AFAEC_0678 [Aliarcobacter faecis]|uniref:hypothetical protein n=1 Tax=Aliarcobacter faecis TaxID=1564138 RepID=UPI00047C49E2|nr:hypothetical protein [Aliarcobacter faecis]QKF72860.1 hypothetical protein AFAEC_0678 [Aliarcobacter faecis]
MLKKVLLICDTTIIEHIFALVCKKMSIDLTIQKSTIVNEEYDFIIVDQPFIDDNFNNYKQYTKRLGAISSEELSFSKARDFIIPRPFLPTKLETILKEQIETLYDDELNYSRREAKYNSFDDEDKSFIVQKNTVLGNNSIFSNQKIIEDQSDDEFDFIDESLVNITSLNNGGILDNNELNKINNILKEEKIQNEIELEKSDWKDISSIIDDALDEVREYEFDLAQNELKTYNLILSKFNIEELRPFLEKFDQTVINRLVNGETVDVKISLKESGNAK